MYKVKEIRDHNQEFAEAQDNYLKNRDVNKLDSVYLILHDYYENLIINYCRKKGVTFSEDERSEKAHDMATRIVSRLMKNPDFKIDKLTSYAIWDFKKIMFQNAEIEMKTCSLDALYETMLDAQQDTKALSNHI